MLVWFLIGCFILCSFSLLSFSDRLCALIVASEYEKHTEIRENVMGTERKNGFLIWIRPILIYFSLYLFSGSRLCVEHSLCLYLCPSVARSTFVTNACMHIFPFKFNFVLIWSENGRDTRTKLTTFATKKKKKKSTRAAFSIRCSKLSETNNKQFSFRIDPLKMTVHFSFFISSIELMTAFSTCSHNCAQFT